MTETQISQALLDSLNTQFGIFDYTSIAALRRAALDAPDSPAYVEPDKPDLSFGALLDLVEKTVKTLNGMGFTPHSRIAMALPSTPESMAAYLSVVCGMTLVPLNPDLPVEEAEGFLKHARADAVIVASAASRAREAARNLGLPVIDMVPLADGPCGLFELRGMAVDPAVAPVFAQPDDLALLLPTSGTTNQRKLIPRSQRDMLLVAVSGVKGLVAGINVPVAVNTTPLFHLGGMYAILALVLLKAPVALVPRFEANIVYRYLALYKPVSFSAVPALLQLLVNAAPEHQAELAQLNMRGIVVGAATLSAPLFKATQEIFHSNILIIYAASEVNTIATTMQNPGDPGYKAGSVGKPVADVRLKVVDEDGIELAPGVQGEIFVQTPLMIHHYENNPEADAEAFSDGWFRIGDTGYVDADGFIYLTGRVKEVINRGGSKISPLDIDAVLRQHPAVVDTAAFAFPHSALGEDVATAVVISDPNVSEADLRLFAAKNLPMSEIPSRFVFVDAIPKTSLGKIKRLALTEQFKDLLQR